MLEIFDPSYSGGSGLEHQNSRNRVLGPGMLGTQCLRCYAHPIFHPRNVKRLRPSDLWLHTGTIRGSSRHAPVVDALENAGGYRSAPSPSEVPGNRKCVNALGF